MLTDKLTDYVHAAFAGIYVQTSEPDQAQIEISRHAQEREWAIMFWDGAQGFRAGIGQAGDEVTSPVPAIKALTKLVMRNKEGEHIPALLVIQNLNRFWTDPETMQATFNQLAAGKVNRTFLVVLSPTVDIPTELTKMFVVIEHDLPDRKQLTEIAKGLLSETPDELPKGEAMDKVLAAASGLTSLEAENAMSLSLVRHDRLLPEVLWEIKAQTLDKSGLCKLYRGEPRSFDELRGVDHIRELTKKLFRQDCPIPPKGWLFTGPPGSGKTSVAKAIATDNDVPLILGDLPGLKGKYVGESEQKIRRFIQLMEAMAPCVVLLDEIEDALAGATQEGGGDSGVSRDQLSTILKWRTESKAKVFLIGTCNEPQSLLKVKQGALVRDGRFDGIVFFDLPDRQTKDQLWSMFREKLHVPGVKGVLPTNPNDEGWSPNNIEVCCQRAVQYDIPLDEAALYVRPTPLTDIEKLREWATGRCLSATAPGIYRGAQANTPVEKMSRALTRKAQ